MSVGRSWNVTMQRRQSCNAARQPANPATITQYPNKFNEVLLMLNCTNIYHTLYDSVCGISRLAHE